MQKTKQFAYAAAIGLPIALCASMTLAAPPSIIVNTTSDANPPVADGMCSLREAIVNVNNGAQTHADCAKPKGKVARIDLTSPGGTLISLADELLVAAPVEITGPGSWALEIERVANDDHFIVSSAMTLSGVRLTGVTGGTGSIRVGNFGVGAPPRSLALDDVVFSGNQGGGNTGGAVSLYNGASATIHDSAFFDNHTPGRGGAIHVDPASSLTVSNSVFVANFADGGGGAIAGLSSSITILDSVFAGNDSLQDGGAITHVSANGASSDTTISNSSLIRNFSDGSGGGYYGEADFQSTLDTTVTGSVIANNQILAGHEDVFRAEGGGATHNYVQVKSMVDVCTNC